MRARGRLSIFLLALFPAALLSAPACETTTVGTTSLNTRTVQRDLTELWSRGDLAVIEENHDPSFVWHVNGVRHAGAENYKAFVSAYREAMPDLEFEIVDLLSQGDRVVAQWIARGTQSGPMPERGLEATGRRAEVDGFTLYRFQRGRVVEIWSTWNEYGFLQQLGVIPAE